MKNLVKIIQPYTAREKSGILLNYPRKSANEAEDKTKEHWCELMFIFSGDQAANFIFLNFLEKTFRFGLVLFLESSDK